MEHEPCPQCRRPVPAGSRQCTYCAAVLDASDEPSPAERAADALLETSGSVSELVKGRARALFDLVGELVEVRTGVDGSRRNVVREPSPEELAEILVHVDAQEFWALFVRLQALVEGGDEA